MNICTLFLENLDEYTKQRLDKVAVDVAVTRSMVESMEKNMASIMIQSGTQESRLTRLEKRMFALWVIGPLLLGVATVLHSYKSWLTER